jgi:hypothetical protein
MTMTSTWPKMTSWLTLMMTTRVVQWSTTANQLWTRMQMGLWASSSSEASSGGGPSRGMGQLVLQQLELASSSKEYRAEGQLQDRLLQRSTQAVLLLVLLVLPGQTRRCPAWVQRQQQQQQQEQEQAGVVEQPQQQANQASRQGVPRGWLLLQLLPSAQQQ